MEGVPDLHIEGLQFVNRDPRNHIVPLLRPPLMDTSTDAVPYGIFVVPVQYFEVSLYVLPGGSQ